MNAGTRKQRFVRTIYELGKGMPAGFEQEW
jgi:hypothetical protein